MTMDNCCEHCYAAQCVALQPLSGFPPIPQYAWGSWSVLVPPGPGNLGPAQPITNAQPSGAGSADLPNSQVQANNVYFGDYRSPVRYLQRVDFYQETTSSPPNSWSRRTWNVDRRSNQIISFKCESSANGLYYTWSKDDGGGITQTGNINNSGVQFNKDLNDIGSGSEATVTDTTYFTQETRGDQFNGGVPFWTYLITLSGPYTLQQAEADAAALLQAFDLSNLSKTYTITNVSNGTTTVEAVALINMIDPVTKFRTEQIYYTFWNHTPIVQRFTKNQFPQNLTTLGWPLLDLPPAPTLSNNDLPFFPMAVAIGPQTANGAFYLSKVIVQPSATPCRMCLTSDEYLNAQPATIQASPDDGLNWRPSGATACQASVGQNGYVIVYGSPIGAGSGLSMPFTFGRTRLMLLCDCKGAQANSLNNGVDGDFPACCGPCWQ